MTTGTHSLHKNEIVQVGALTIAGAAMSTGVGTGYKIARGVHQQVGAADTIDAGLTTVVAVVVSFIQAPNAKQAFVTATVGNQSGAPVAGSFVASTWKSTYAAADDFGDNLSFAWIAVGT